MDNNNINLFQIIEGEFLVSKRALDYDLMLSGTVTGVMSQVTELLANSSLDMSSDSSFEELKHDAQNIATIKKEDTWLMIHVNEEYHIFKNPAGTTQTIHQAFKGSLTNLVNKLYEFLTK